MISGLSEGNTSRNVSGGGADFTGFHLGQSITKKIPGSDRSGFQMFVGTKRPKEERSIQNVVRKKSRNWFCLCSELGSGFLDAWINQEATIQEKSFSSKGSIIQTF